MWNIILVVRDQTERNEVKKGRSRDEMARRGKTGYKDHLKLPQRKHTEFQDSVKEDQDKRVDFGAIS